MQAPTDNRIVAFFRKAARRVGGCRRKRLSKLRVAKHKRDNSTGTSATDESSLAASDNFHASAIQWATEKQLDQDRAPAIEMTLAEEQEPTSTPLITEDKKHGDNKQIKPCQDVNSILKRSCEEQPYWQSERTRGRFHRFSATTTLRKKQPQSKKKVTFPIEGTNLHQIRFVPHHSSWTEEDRSRLTHCYPEHSWKQMLKRNARQHRLERQLEQLDEPNPQEFLDTNITCTDNNVEGDKLFSEFVEKFLQNLDCGKICLPRSSTLSTAAKTSMALAESDDKALASPRSRRKTLIVGKTPVTKTDKRPSNIKTQKGHAEQKDRPTELTIDNILDSAGYTSDLEFTMFGLTIIALEG